MAYIDDTNCLLPLEDVLFFLQHIDHYGVPLGAIMNTNKTRILTSTSGSSFLAQYIVANPIVGQDLHTAINRYSTHNSQMHEEVNSLCILGSPIGSQASQRQFISNYLSQAHTNAINLLDSLDNEQTIL
jgi:hypothetical protein